ncbi:hypothetical protein [Thermohalobacter berrensis]|nr:hypothetical protein [Thermohalobacter berrensis]
MRIDNGQLRIENLKKIIVISGWWLVVRESNLQFTIKEIKN